MSLNNGAFIVSGYKLRRIGLKPSALRAFEIMKTCACVIVLDYFQPLELP